MNHYHLQLRHEQLMAKADGDGIAIGPGLLHPGKGEPPILARTPRRVRRSLPTRNRGHWYVYIEEQTRRRSLASSTRLLFRALVASK